MVKANEIGKKMLEQIQHLPDVMLKGGLAYAGYRATGNWGGALTALVGLRLAEGNNLVGGAAGVTALGLIGLSNAFKDVPLPLAIVPTIPDPDYVYPEGLSYALCAYAKQYLGFKPEGCP